MIISLIVAAATNNAIGNNNQLLWKLPNDLKFFKNTTWANAIVMGRKTFESLGNKPLPGRLNIVITRQNNWQAPGVSIVHSLDDAIFLAKSHQYKELFVAGGGEIYKEALSRADKIYLTRVHTSIDGDTFFPEIDLNKWQMETDLEFAADAKHAYPYSFQLWKHK
jgi:dihydrofolate reductase